jgi:hypothetical protein
MLIGLIFITVLATTHLKDLNHIFFNIEYHLLINSM